MQFRCFRIYVFKRKKIQITISRRVKMHPRPLKTRICWSFNSHWQIVRSSKVVLEAWVAWARPGLLQDGPRRTFLVSRQGMETRRTHTERPRLSIHIIRFSAQGCWNRCYGKTVSHAISIFRVCFLEEKDLNNHSEQPEDDSNRTEPIPKKSD